MKVQTTGGTLTEDVGVKLCGVPESVALTVNAYVPFVVALPVIAPDALRLRFGGKLPLARLQETAPIWFWVHGRSTAIHPLQ